METVASAYGKTHRTAQDAQVPMIVGMGRRADGDSKEESAVQAQRGRDGAAPFGSKRVRGGHERGSLDFGLRAQDDSRLGINTGAITRLRDTGHAEPLKGRPPEVDRLR